MTNHDGPSTAVRWKGRGVACIALIGEHDLHASGELERTLTETLAISSHLIVDLSDAEFVDSSIIRVLINAKKLADSTAKTFSLVLGESPMVERVLEICDVLPLLNRVHTLDEALLTSSEAEA